MNLSQFRPLCRVKFQISGVLSIYSVLAPFICRVILFLCLLPFHIYSHQDLVIFFRFVSHSYKRFMLNVDKWQNSPRARRDQLISIKLQLTFEYQGNNSRGLFVLDCPSGCI